MLVLPTWSTDAAVEPLESLLAGGQVVRLASDMHAVYKALAK